MFNLNKRKTKFSIYLRTSLELVIKSKKAKQKFSNNLKFDYTIFYNYIYMVFALVVCENVCLSFS